jgi:hypothetical protein
MSSYLILPRCWMLPWRNLIPHCKIPKVSFDRVEFYHDSSHLIGVDTMKLAGTGGRKSIPQLVPDIEKPMLYVSGPEPMVESMG